MRVLKKLLLILLIFAGFCLLGGLIAVVVGYNYLAKDLPKISKIDDYRPAVATRVFAVDGSLMGEFFEERRHPIGLERVPEQVRQAFLAAEDADFYEHDGIDPKGIIRAVIANAKTGERTQGASTITQQVVKRIFLSPERSYERKLKEWILAWRLERHLSKDEILEIYLNEIFFGHNAYGISAAAQVYFGKEVEELTLSESTLLAGLPKAPSRHNPYNNIEAAKIRQLYVLDQMVANRMINSAERDLVYSVELNLQPATADVNPAAEYLEWIRRVLVERYGNDTVLREGLTVETVMDPVLQRAGRAAVSKGLRAIDRRMGYRGPLERVDWKDSDKILEELRKQVPETGAILQGLVRAVHDKNKQVIVDVGPVAGEIALLNMDWATKPDPDVHFSARVLRRPSQALEVGDLVLVRVLGSVVPGHPLSLALEQVPEVQGALLAIEPGTRHVRAMIGAYDPAASEFNRAMQARRQPGSSFKPLIYTAAFEQGRTPADIVVDSPIIAKNDLASFLRGGWKPHNFDGKFRGPIMIRDALAHSRNVPTIKVLREMGVSKVIELAKRMDIQSPLSRDLTLALGSSGLPLYELTNAYATFAEGGIKRDPVFIRRVLDRDGNVLEETEEAAGVQVIDEEIAFQTTYLMRQVVEIGTARAARELGRPAAGKTGTTNDYIDAWFMGFTPNLVCGVWTGLDERQSMGRGETGSRAALPIWLDFMKAAHVGEPVQPFRAPANIQWRSMASTGGPARPGQKSVRIPMREGTSVTTERRSAGSRSATPEGPQMHMLP